MWVIALHSVSLLGPACSLSPSFQLAQAIFEPNLFPYKYSSILKPCHSSYLFAYEDGTDRVFRKIGIHNSDTGELARRKHATEKKSFIEGRKNRIQVTNMITSLDGEEKIQTRFLVGKPTTNRSGVKSRHWWENIKMDHKETDHLENPGIDEWILKWTIQNLAGTTGPGLNWLRIRTNDGLLWW